MHWLQLTRTNDDTIVMVNADQILYGYSYGGYHNDSVDAPWRRPTRLVFAGIGDGSALHVKESLAQIRMAIETISDEDGDGQ